MKKRRYLLLLIPVLLVVASITYWCLPPRTQITMENASRLRIGMSRAEVHAILGPPRNEQPDDSDADERKHPDMECWNSDCAFIRIIYEGGTSKVFLVIPSPKDSRTPRGLFRQAKEAVGW
jgi:hypothetical protein